MISIVKADPLFLEEVNVPPVYFGKEDYLLRIDLMAKRLKEKKLSHILIYGDREHFANIEYFTGYDSRFEESVVVISDSGKVTLIVGNEGYDYCQTIPYDFDRYLYQNFSLQGQPRYHLVPYENILEKIGITSKNIIGLSGIRYFNPGDIHQPNTTFDWPEYLMTATRKVTTNLVNATGEITGLPHGIRMSMHTAKDIAWAEAAGNRVARVVQKMIKNLEVGMSEYQLAMTGEVGFDPQSSHPLTNFGKESVALGMRSPTLAKLELGTPMGICYNIRGNLTSRVSLAATDLASCGEYAPFVETFYKKHFKAMANWYKTAKIGVLGGVLYDSVLSIVPGEEFGVTLNPGHNTGTDEWSNTPSFKGSAIPLHDGTFMQVDFIASNTSDDLPRTAICEDAVVFAGEKLRKNLEQEYPETYKRILRRQQVMRNILGIEISDEILPLSNLNGANFPFMLDPTQVFSAK